MKDISINCTHKQFIQPDKAVPVVTELYTDEDNMSYFRDTTIETPITHPLGSYSDKVKVLDLQFRSFLPNSKFSWHTAPHKQYIIYLEGKVLVEASGGESRVFKPGDILLANDLSGKGHITTTLTSGRSIVITTV